MNKNWMWFNEVVSFFRKKIDKSIDADMTTAILTYLKYPFGKYKNSDGTNIYPISIIEGYFDTPFDRRRINDIIETIRYNKLTSEEIRQRQEKAIKEYTRPPKEIEKMWNEIQKDRLDDYIKYIENNPPETSMQYVSDQYLDEKEYTSIGTDTICFSNNWVFVTYGSDMFEPNRFERLHPSRLANHKLGFMYQKYSGGLWACPLSKNGWEKWCREEDFNVEKLSSHFLFTLKENARIYIISFEDDLVTASTLVDRLGIHYINYDELIENGYDGLFVTDQAIMNMRDGLKYDGEYYEGLSTFDVESLCIFNPDVIVPVEDNVINEEQLSDVDPKWEPKEGLFKSKSPKYIADYLCKHSKDIGQAIKRLTFYMNRVGKNIENKTVLNKAKSILQNRLEESVSENEYNTQEAINAVVDQGILLADDIEKTYYMDNGGFSICVIVKKTNSSYENNKVVYCFDNKKVLTPEPISNIYYLNKRSTAKEKFFLIKHIDKKYDSEPENLLSEDGIVFDGWAYIRDLYNGDFIVEPYDLKINDEEYPFLWNMDGSYKMKDIINIKEFDNNIDFLYMESFDGNKVLDKNYNVIIDSVESIDEDDVALMYRKSHEYDRDGNIEEPVFVITVASEYGKSQNIYNYNMQLIFEDISTYDTKRIGDYIQMIYVRTYEGYNMVGKGGRRFFDKPAENINNEFISDVEMIDYVRRTDGKCNLILCDTLELYDEDWFDDIVYIDKEIAGYYQEYIVALKRNKNIYLIGLNDSEDSYLREILDEPVQGIYIIGEEQRILEIKKDGKYYLLLKNCKLIPVSRFGIEEHPDDECICYVEDENGKFDIINLSSGKSFCDEYLGGLRFDSISDKSSRYPIVESKGKYTYFDTCLFCLEFSERSIPHWYDKAEPAIYDEENDEYTFNVELNGEKRTISSVFGEEDE